MITLKTFVDKNRWPILEEFFENSKITINFKIDYFDWDVFWYFMNWNRWYKDGYGLIDQTQLPQFWLSRPVENFRENTIVHMWGDINNLDTFGMLYNGLRNKRPFRWVINYLNRIHT